MTKEKTKKVDCWVGPAKEEGLLNGPGCPTSQDQQRRKSFKVGDMGGRQDVELHQYFHWDGCRNQLTHGQTGRQALCPRLTRLRALVLLRA